MNAVAGEHFLVSPQTLLERASSGFMRSDVKDYAHRWFGSGVLSSTTAHGRRVRVKLLAEEPPKEISTDDAAPIGMTVGVIGMIHLSGIDPRAPSKAVTRKQNG